MRFKNFLPEDVKWRNVAIILLATTVGLGFFMAREAKIFSYLSDDPQACVNCHVMTPVYNSWMHSSHREWASCNDCHVPHNNIVNQYYFKAKDGLFHASVFTARAEPDVMFMRAASEEVVQNNCIRCHVQQVTQVKYDGYIEDHYSNRTDRQCWSCHKEVPHGKIHGLTTIRNNIAPIPTDTDGTVVPKWLKAQIKEKAKNK